MWRGLDALPSGVQVSSLTPGHVWSGACWASAHTEGDWGPDKGTAGREAESLASGPEAVAYSWGAEPAFCGGVAGGAGRDLEDRDGQLQGRSLALRGVARGLEAGSMASELGASGAEPETRGRGICGRAGTECRRGGGEQS